MNPATVELLPEWNDEQMLRVLREALISGISVTSYSINGRSVVHTSPEALQRLIVIYERRVIAAKGMTPRVIARFPGL